jgi:hypothetical protein
MLMKYRMFLLPVVAISTTSIPAIAQLLKHHSTSWEAEGSGLDGGGWFFSIYLIFLPH